jgi:hypothetical protein
LPGESTRKEFGRALLRRRSIERSRDERRPVDGQWQTTFSPFRTATAATARRRGMKTSFMRAARGPLTAKGRLLHRTATLAFTEASIFDASDKLCAHATGTFKYVARLPTGPGSTQPLNRISTD